MLLRDYRKVENTSFFAMTVGIASWCLGIAGFIGSNDLGKALIWAKFYYSAPLLIVVSAVIFSQHFLYLLRISRILILSVVSSGIALALLLILSKSFIIAEVVMTSYGKQVIFNNAEYIVYGGYLLASFGLVITTTYKKAKDTHHKSVSQQAKIFLVGFIVSAVLGVLFNLILPGLGDYSLISIGPVATAVLAATITYGIIKHKLFDVRLVLARTLAYVGSLGLLSFLYGFIVLGLAQMLFSLRLTLASQVFLSLATAVAGVAFGRFKTIFDRSTQRVFYKDGYDAQALFDRLNKILVAAPDLNELADKSTALLSATFKADYCFLELHSDIAETDKNARILGKGLALPTRLLRTVDTHAEEVIATDYTDITNGTLKQQLRDTGVGIIAKINPGSQTAQSFGYLVFGQKKSGNAYTLQDLSVIESVANELAIAIQNALHYEEIQNFNTTLQQRVDDATRKLRRTNQRLKELDEAKDDFVSMASHQLRTPLTAIKGNVSLVMEGDAGPVTKTQVELLGQAFASSQRMVFLIADLLNVSRLKTGKFVIEPGRVNLADMVAQEVTQLQETAQSRQVSLAFAKPETFSTLKLDETKTRQVIMNFIDNAIYYTPSGGAIEVSLKESDKEVEFRVKDNGIGVPRHEQPHLFTKFYRAENARKARPDGTGLGLFMAKKIIVAQGGAIIFETKEGKGSTFGFRFPKAHLVV